MHGVKTRWLLVPWMNDMQDHEVLFSRIPFTKTRLKTLKEVGAVRADKGVEV